MLFETLISKIGPTLFHEASAELLATQRPFDDGRESPSFIHDIDAILALDNPAPAARRDVWLKLTVQLPCYATWMYLYHVHKYHLDGQQRQPVFLHIREILSSSQPSVWREVCYSLWVDFFEDTETVTETWNSLAPETLEKLPLERLMPFTGPVPYDLKRALYHKLVLDESFQAVLFEGLNASAFDVYGQLDKVDALTLLKRLEHKVASDKFLQSMEKIAR